MPVRHERPLGDVTPRRNILHKSGLLVPLGMLLCIACAGSGPGPSASAGRGSDQGTDAPASARAPRLVVWLTIDQFRGDYYQRYHEHFVSGGLRRLFEQGMWYQNAHFSHAITETAPGHATLFTGAAPDRHGIVANSWLEDGAEVASVADSEFDLVGPGVDPAVHAEGRSPRRLLMPTVADALDQATTHAAGIFSVSAKDRGAILPGGQAGKAFWLGARGFVSSRFYGSEVPTWLVRHHESFPPQSYLSDGWSLALPEQSYLNAEAQSPHAFVAFGKGFPHRVAPTERNAQALRNTPFADSAVLHLARTIVQHQHLGNDSVVDLLALSLSSTDYIGHAYGPESRETEDQIVRLDRELHEFFQFLDEQVDEDALLLVLSSDHGGCESPSYLSQSGVVSGRLTEHDVIGLVRAGLQERYQKQDYLKDVVSPYVYLNHAAIERDGVPFSEVAQAMSRLLEESPWIRSALLRPKPAGSASSSAEQASPSTGLLRDQVALSFYPGRSGDIYVVPAQRVHFVQEQGLAATHGSPWEYDTHVPIVLSGLGIRAGVHARRVDVRSLAPTVARLMRIPAPTAASAPLLPGLF